MKEGVRDALLREITEDSAVNKFENPRNCWKFGVVKMDKSLCSEIREP